MMLPTGSRANNRMQLQEVRVRALETAIKRIPSRFPTPQTTTNCIVDKGIRQSGHGFGVGSVVYYDSGSDEYAGAQASDPDSCVYLGVVSSVPDADTFDLTYAGIVNGATAFDAGTIYYLSDVTAGQVLNAPPTNAGSYVVPVFECDDDTGTLYVYASRPLGSDHLTLHAGDPTNGGGSLRVHATPNIYLDLDASGVLSLHDASNTNVLSADLSTITDTSKTVQFTKWSVCDPTSGTIKSAWFLSTGPF